MLFLPMALAVSFIPIIDVISPPHSPLVTLPSPALPRSSPLGFAGNGQPKDWFEFKSVVTQRSRKPWRSKKIFSSIQSCLAKKGW